jgi:hypothetical protein
MSLDVYLHGEPELYECECPDCGHKHLATLSTSLFDANITHNLNKMADAAGIYEALWRPDEHGFVRARDIIPILERGLTQMEEEPRRFQQFDSSNGWGTYDDFVPWVRRYLQACREWPDAYIRVSR